MVLGGVSSYHPDMSTYLLLTRDQNDAAKVLINMDRVASVESTPKGTSRLYTNEAEAPFYVVETLDQITAMLEARRA